MRFIPLLLLLSCSSVSADFTSYAVALNEECDAVGQPPYFTVKLSNGAYASSCETGHPIASRNEDTGCGYAPAYEDRSEENMDTWYEYGDCSGDYGPIDTADYDTDEEGNFGIFDQVGDAICRQPIALGAKGGTIDCIN